MTVPGTRIGAFYTLTKTRAVMFGYGIFESDEIPPENILGPMGPAYLLGMPVPKLRLDDGTTVWGCECWWGPEDEVKETFAGLIVQGINIETQRRKNDGRWAKVCLELDTVEESLVDPTSSSAKADMARREQ